MSRVKFEGVSHVYPGTAVPAVRDLDLRVEHGEFLTLVGPSGSGKTTILRLLAGLERARTGRILIDDVSVGDLPAGDRGIAAIGAGHPLYPHLSVSANLGFVLSMEGSSASVVAARVAEVARALNLTDLLTKFPRDLTRGQRHTVAIGRALAHPPKVLVLDEPLSEFDPAERRQACAQLGLMQRTWVTTTIYVTQNQNEAMTLSDRVAVLDHGQLQQVAPPLDVYHQPDTIAVAQFFGTPPMNTLHARIGSEGAMVGGLVLPVPWSVREALLGPHVVVGIRAEHVHLLPRGAAMRVGWVDNTGIDAFVHGYLEGDDARQPVLIRTPGRVAPRPGETVFIEVLMDDHVLFFDPATGLRV